MNNASRKLLCKIFRGFKQPIKTYKIILQKHPIIVQALQTGCLYGTSDIIAQKIFDDKKFNEMNVKRTMVFASTGVFFTGPVVSLWYRLLANKIGTSGTWTVVKKVLIDQFLFTPFFHFVLITTINTLHGHSRDFIEEQIRLKYFDILTTSIKLWPFAQFVNFTFVPTNYQVLFGQVVALFWNIYISWKTQHGVKKPDWSCISENRLQIIDIKNN